MPTPPVTVIVPVMRRPQNAEPFMASLLETTDRADVLVVADEDDDDTWRAWLQAMPKGAGRVVRSAWPAPGGTFPQKINYGFQVARPTEWIFIVGDDVKFHDGWLDALLEVVPWTDADVIGTNAPNASDDWSPHLLIRRRYVVEKGASWDGLGVVCHEGYRHSYVDTEICRVAKQRDVYRTVKGSNVEHLHPTFRAGEWDDVYRLGQSTVDVDAATWRARLEEFLQVAA